MINDAWPVDVIQMSFGADLHEADGLLTNLLPGLGIVRMNTTEGTGSSRRLVRAFLIQHMMLGTERPGRKGDGMVDWLCISDAEFCVGRDAHNAGSAQ